MAWDTCGTYDMMSFGDFFKEKLDVEKDFKEPFRDLLLLLSSIP